MKTSHLIEKNIPYIFRNALCFYFWDEKPAKETINKAKNILTRDEMIFINDLTLVENMVNAIISIEKNTSNLLNDSLRKKIIAENNLIEHTSNITGRRFVYCAKYDLIAH